MKYIILKNGEVFGRVQVSSESLLRAYLVQLVDSIVAQEENPCTVEYMTGSPENVHAHNGTFEAVVSFERGEFDELGIFSEEFRFTAVPEPELVVL